MESIAAERLNKIGKANGLMQTSNTVYINLLIICVSSASVFVRATTLSQHLIKC